MNALETFVSTVIWPNAMLAIPLFLAVAALNRWLPSRPSTRHALWACALLLLLVPTTIIGLAGRPAAQSLQRLAVSAAEPSETVLQFDDLIHSTPADAAPHAVLDDARATAPSVPVRTASPEPLPPTDVAIATSPPAPSFTSPSDAQPQWIEASTSTLPDASVNSGLAPAASLTWPVAERPATIDTPRPRLLAAVDVEPRRIPTPAPIVNLTPPPAAIAPAIVEPAPAEPVDDAAASDHDVTIAGPASTSDWTSEWTARVAAARDAIVAIPPLPAVIWISGAAALLMLGLIRFVHVARLARSAAPASEQVEQLVWSVAEDIGLSTAPLVRMTERPVTPMVLCLGRPTLILPRGLWSQLDHAGRRAVVVHELAHLRRRDHWMSWMDLVVGLVYWWHPGVWWARRQLCEQADASCDAWVVALMPESRRAYAEALLTARSQGSQDFFGAPAVGLGVTTRRAKRFARRLTMVMTEQKAPGRSLTGAGLASVLSLGALVAAPMFACPDKECDVAEASADAAVIADFEADLIDEAALEQLAQIGENAFFQPQPDNWRERDRDDRRERDRRGGDLESRVDRMEAMLDEILRRLEDRDVRRDGPDMERERRLAEENLRRAREAQEQAMRQRDRARGAGQNGSPGEIVERVYEISGGKREMLLGLMLRDDVPVRVAERPNGILVQATPQQQMIFEAFVMIISSDKQEDREYRLSKGKLDALTELMIRSDVPVMVRPADDKITVLGSPIEQAIFQGFVDMIEPRGDVPARSMGRGGGAGGLMGGQRGGADALQHEIEMLEQQARIHEELLVDAEREVDMIHREIEAVSRQVHEHDGDHELHRALESLHNAHEVLMRQLDERRMALEQVMQRRAELIAERERMMRRGGR